MKVQNTLFSRMVVPNAIAFSLNVNWSLDPACHTQHCVIAKKKYIYSFQDNFCIYLHIHMFKKPPHESVKTLSDI